MPIESQLSIINPDGSFVLLSECQPVPDIKFCPFCGAPGALEHSKSDNNKDTYYVRCTECECSLGEDPRTCAEDCADSHYFKTMEAAVSAWNTRHMPMPAPGWTPARLGQSLIAWGDPVKPPILVDHWCGVALNPPDAKDQTAVENDASQA